jgi:L-Lysine epsilon oxidase N-terminal/L-lysine epsilon oxidase C-terminal domain
MRELDEISAVAIYPAIGIARIGNSPNEYFIGPEIPGILPHIQHDYRDLQGRILRQAARFRLFGLDADGKVIKELSADDGDITWSVHVANAKAAWYQFVKALDLGESAGTLSSDTGGIPAVACPRRNPKIHGVGCSDLVIDPGPRLITGRNLNEDGSQPQYAFNTGTFHGTPVYLGELRTDAKGNLIFLGGRGHSSTFLPGPPPGFANNPGWHDDIADGPVDATIQLKDGRTYQAIGAWVITAPPDFAPGVRAFVTGYDLAFETAIQLDPSLNPAKPGFFEHIYPILERISINQWVNAGVALAYGWGSPADFTNPEFIARLSDPGDRSQPLRQAIFQMFRNPDYQIMDANGWPPIYGDAVSLDFNTTDPREWMAILESQYAALRRWAEGDFVQDAPPAIKTWTDLSPAQLADGLTRANLQETIGGPFHPGCEFTWPMRNKILYGAPFRIKRRAAPEPDYGDELTSSIAMMPGGPLDGSGPGAITRWMACPWQTDTASCLSAYRAYAGEYLPTFWPARVPNDVLTEDAYHVLMDPQSPIAQKQRAFQASGRKKWLRGIVYTDTTPPARLQEPNPRQVFVEHWWRCGIVVQKPGPEDSGLFPKALWVETGRTLPEQPNGAVAEAVPTHMRSLLSQR